MGGGDGCGELEIGGEGEGNGERERGKFYSFSDFFNKTGVPLKSKNPVNTLEKKCLVPYMLT